MHLGGLHAGWVGSFYPGQMVSLRQPARSFVSLFALRSASPAALDRQQGPLLASHLRPPGRSLQRAEREVHIGLTAHSFNPTAEPADDRMRLGI